MITGPSYEIGCAADRELFQGAQVPQMRQTVIGWFRAIVLTKIVKKQVDFRTVEVEEPINARGVIQPMSSKRLEMKPEGQRAFEWLTLHATPDLVLQPDDVVMIRNRKFRVEGAQDFSEYGYVFYELVNAYRNA